MGGVDCLAALLYIILSLYLCSVRTPLWMSTLGKPSWAAAAAGGDDADTAACCGVRRSFLDPASFTVFMSVYATF